jgi:MFS transporter, FHS family, L-fucose permease
MVTREIMPRLPSTDFARRQKAPTVAPVEDYSRPLAIVTTLFFMWGFLTCLNDILVPHLKSIFDLSYARVMLVQFAFFSAYFLFSIPWSKIVNAIGYQKTMVVRLLTMAAGAFLFLPAASAASYPLFLTALIVLAAGITGLQVAANPYVVVLGMPVSCYH